MNDLEVLNVSGLGAADIEEAVGNIRRRFPNRNQNEQSALVANELAQKAFRNSLMTRAMQFMGMNAKHLSVDARSAIQNGKGRWTEADFYIRKEITAGNGTQDMIRSSDREAVGVSNVNGNRLNKGSNASIDKVRVSWAKHATITDASKLAYSNTDATVDAAVLNGELIIDINDRIVLRKPIAAFFNPGGAYSGVQGNFDVVTLQRPFLIPEDTEIKVLVKLPDGSTLAGTHTFLEVRMMGSTLITG